MHKYRVAVNGENCRVLLDEKVTVLGFYTYRFVEAENPDEAREVAWRLVQDSLKETIKNGPDDLPRLVIEEVESVSRMQRQPGFV